MPNVLKLLRHKYSGTEVTGHTQTKNKSEQNQEAIHSFVFLKRGEFATRDWLAFKQCVFPLGLFCYILSQACLEACKPATSTFKVSGLSPGKSILCRSKPESLPVNTTSFSAANITYHQQISARLQ